MKGPWIRIAYFTFAIRNRTTLTLKTQSKSVADDILTIFIIIIIIFEKKK